MKRYILILTVLLIPTFSLMLRPGIYTMHDFHVFRQQQFEKCLTQGYFPCRWAPDAGLGYGEPLFNYYGQFPYWIGHIIHLTGMQIIDVTKTNFVLTLILSAVTMFFLARKFWGNIGGVISATFYIYAPYRAVDIWVRGALNEAYAFAFIPVIFLLLDNFLNTQSHRSFFWLVLSLTALLITHNLSFLMLIPFLTVWIVIRLWKKTWKPLVLWLVSLPLLVFLLSGFYLLSVIFESHLVTLGQTTQNYYNYLIHYVSLYQLFISHYWGYGGSTWGPNDTMSFSVGLMHWTVPVIILLVFIFKYLTSNPSPNLGEGNARGEVLGKVLFFTSLGFFAIFLTHGKSEFIWKLLPPMAYIQFPWRFLTFSTFFLSLAAGAATLVISKKIATFLIGLIILINFSFFRPDIWRPITDTQQFAGPLWDEERSSALHDFWPATSPKVPTTFAPTLPQVLLTTTKYRKIQYPVVNFPGWKAWLDNQPLEIFSSGDLGLITARIPPGEHQVKFRFTNTFVRSLGNWTSLITILVFLLWRIKYAKN